MLSSITKPLHVNLPVELRKKVSLEAEIMDWLMKPDSRFTKWAFKQFTLFVVLYLVVHLVLAFMLHRLP